MPYITNNYVHHQTCNLHMVQIDFVILSLQIVISIISELLKLEIPQCYLAIIDMPSMIQLNNHLNTWSLVTQRISAQKIHGLTIHCIFCFKCHTHTHIYMNKSMG